MLLARALFAQVFDKRERAMKWKQRHKNSYGYDSGDKRAELRDQAERDAEAQERPELAVTHTDEVLADIDEALQGLDQDLGLTYTQAGGQ